MENEEQKEESETIQEVEEHQPSQEEKIIGIEEKPTTKLSEEEFQTIYQKMFGPSRITQTETKKEEDTANDVFQPISNQQTIRINYHINILELLFKPILLYK